MASSFFPHSLRVLVPPSLLAADSTGSLGKSRVQRPRVSIQLAVRVVMSARVEAGFSFLPGSTRRARRSSVTAPAGPSFYSVSLAHHVRQDLRCEASYRLPVPFVLRVHPIAPRPWINTTTGAVHGRGKLFQAGA